MEKTVGQRMYDLCEEMFPICRSLSGDGFRQSLAILQRELPGMKKFEVPSGTQVFDWTVPKEWNVKAAYIEYINEDGSKEKVIDMADCNLHVMGYSLPLDKVVSLEELKPMIFTLQDQPNAIPYVTSYYKERSGFCMCQDQFDGLKEGNYHIVIDSTLEDGALTYGELIIPGETDEEILITSYLCHPSMANNELSGPAVLVELAKWIESLENRKYTYRFVINPETIGSITYLSKNFEYMKDKVVAGFVLSCVGDDRTYSHISSRYGDNLADKALTNVLKFHYPEYKEYSFLNRGSDERQFCAPGIDLPVCGFSRSKYGQYPEYHTSLDDMSLISPEGLTGAFEVMQKVINALEMNGYYKIKCLCEPQLGKRGLYPSVSKKGIYDAISTMVDFIAYADGRNDLFDISEIIGKPVDMILDVVKNLNEAELLEKN